MRDTSHSPIVPCGPLEQSPFGDNFRHALTALLSSGLVSGENAGVGWGGGETLGLSSKFRMATTKARAVLYAKLYISHYARLGFGCVYLRTHRHYKNSATCRHGA